MHNCRSLELIAGGVQDTAGAGDILGAETSWATAGACTPFLPTGADAALLMAEAGATFLSTGDGVTKVSECG